MHFNNDTEMNQSSNGSDRTINLTSCKNFSTSSSDSGVIFIDNMPEESMTKDNPTATGIHQCNSNKNATETTIDLGAHDGQRISIEHTVNIHKKTPGNGRTKNSSPTLSIRSTSISIVSIDENAIDSSCIDSDSEVEPDADADAEGVHSGYTVQKLGQQISYPPNSADLPQLNKGLKVVSQQIRPNELQPSNGMNPNPAAMAEQLFNGCLAARADATTPTTPKIGSIALNNSTDVTFGDKHFYEGPVTIQQFLIDNREKWKHGQAHDNPNFNTDSMPNATAADAKGGVPPNQAKKPVCPFLPSSISRKAIAITATLAFSLIILAIVLAQTTTIFDKTSNKNVEGVDIVSNGTLQFVSIREWGGDPPRQPLNKLSLPAHRVVISHTASDNCESLTICSYRVRVIQQFHMSGFNWDQVGYNFLVGGDGRVYVGRGWDDMGAHTKGYNVDSIGISFIGTFNGMKPPKQQLLACQLLIEEGVRLKKLTPDYKLFGHRQLSATESPDHDNIGGGKVLRIVARDGWLAQPPQKPLAPLPLPVSLLIALPTNTGNCSTQAQCTFRVRLRQTFDIESLQHDDISFNFLIGGDGNVYEGRGWDLVGAHMKGYNVRSLSFAYIGSFRKTAPSSKQLNVTRLLINEGVRLGKINANYKFIGASSLEPTVTDYNADMLYESFSQWPHWSKTLSDKNA